MRILIATTVFFLIVLAGGKLLLYESWLESFIAATIGAVIWFVGMRFYLSKVGKKN